MSLTRKNALITVFWSGISTLQFFLKSIFFIALFLKYRTQLEYGFWIIIMSFYAMTVYVCDGYVRYCLNEYNLEYHKDKTAANRHFRSGLSFLAVISAVILCVSLLLLQYLPVPASIFNTDDATVRSNELHYCLFIVMVVGLAHCIVKYISGAIEPEGKIHISNRYIAVCGISETVLYFICAWLGYELIVIFLAMVVLYAFINTLYLLSLFRRHQVYRRGLWGNAREGLGRFTKSLFFIANNFFEKLAQDGLNFLIALVYLPALLPVYATTRTMANVMVTTVNTFISVFTIEFQRLSITREVPRLLKIMQATWLFIGLFTNFGLVWMYPLLTKIYNLWTHDKLPVHNVFFFVIISAVVLNVFGVVPVLYLKSLNAIRSLFPVSVSRALLIFLLVVILPHDGLYLAMSILVVEFIVNAFLLNLLLRNEIRKLNGVNISAMLFRSVLPFAVTAIYLPLTAWFDPSYLTAAISGTFVLALVYGLQLMYMKNELLVSYPRLIRSVLTSAKDSD